MGDRSAKSHAVLLFLPKLLSLLLILKNRGQRGFSAGLSHCARASASKSLYRRLLAPVRMLVSQQVHHATLIGKANQMGARNAELTTRQAWMEHSLACAFYALALAWIVGMSWVNPAVSVWLLPVAAHSFLSIPAVGLFEPRSWAVPSGRWRLFLSRRAYFPARHRRICRLD